MRRTVLCVSAALATFGISTISATADDRETCYRSRDTEAISACDRLIHLHPDNPHDYLARGDAYRDKGDNDRAIADYDQAIRLDPKLALAYYHRGVVYQHKGDNDHAFSDFDQAIRLDPKLALAYGGRGATWSNKGDYDRAIADFDQAIRLDPKLAAAYRDRGGAYQHKGDDDRALSDFDQAIRLDPKLALAYSARARAYASKGDYDRAMADLDQSLKLDPNDAYARQGREFVGAALAARTGPAPAQAPLPSQTPPPQPAIVNIPSERRVALVIGNSGYTSGAVQPLPNPRRDAKLVAGGLRQAGFEVTELVDLDRNGMAQALHSFRTKAASADWALIYFAGHGIEINRVNYLIPVDAKLADSGDVELETVSYEAMLNAAGGAKALRIIVLDACRNNPFKVQMHQTAALRGSLDRGLAPPPETEPGTLVVYSAKEGQVAVDGDGINSPFALAFVARLKKPGREVQRMFDDVRDDVLQATDKRQQPYKYGSLPGSQDFFFVAGK